MVMAMIKVIMTKMSKIMMSITYGGNDDDNEGDNDDDDNN